MSYSNLASHLDVTMTGGEARRIFDLQYAASRSQAKPDLQARRDSLDRLRRMITQNETALISTISEDFGNRSSSESKLLEIVPLLNGIRFTKGKLARWMKPQRRHVDIAFQPAKAWVRYEPLGVIGVISPWNYPLFLALGPVVDALAAGNRVMIKPSELTPGFSALLQRLIGEFFAESEVAVVTGGVEEAQTFAHLPFDHLLFTGSTAIGRKVMQAAATNLTPVTLELGGKSPAVLCPDFSIEKAAHSIAFGKFINSGQTCIAPDYVLVPAAKAKEFAEAVIAKARQAYPTISDNADYSSVIAARHFDRLTRAIDEARAAGATVLSHDDPRAASQRKIGPTVVLDAPPAGVLLTEEIFGPVLPIIPYDSLTDAIRYINERDRPLALYCFSNDSLSQNQVLDGTMSGGVTLNGTILHVAQDTLPFGGVGPSGIGAYHGHAGFLRMSHERSVHKIGFLNAFQMMGPPWGRLAAIAATLLSRR